jgi:DNA-binding PadR family transcriptional regulator
MTSPITVYKLIVLYMLDRTGDAIAKTTISDFLLDQSVTNNYLSVQQAISQMEESGLITSETMGSRTMIRITKEGQETLRFFENELNPEIRRQCTEFLRRNGMEIRDEAKTSAKYYKKVTGDYEVDLTVNERDTTLCALRLDVPDESIAKTVTQNWLEKNEDIYQYLVKELF